MESPPDIPQEQPAHEEDGEKRMGCIQSHPLVFAMVAMWITIFGGWPLALINLLQGLVLLHRQKARLEMALLVVLSPFMIFFLWGIVDYSTGNVSYRLPNAPNLRPIPAKLESRNHDPRAEPVAGQRHWNDSRPMRLLEPKMIANAGVRLMIKCLGPVVPRYDGPYPEKATAISLTAKAAEIAASKSKPS